MKIPFLKNLKRFKKGNPKSLINILGDFHILLLIIAIIVTIIYCLLISDYRIAEQGNGFMLTD